MKLKPHMGSSWLLAEPEQMSWGKQGQLPPCCDLPEELSVTDWQPGNTTYAKDDANLDSVK